MKDFKISRENLSIENGKVLINSEELANMIQEEVLSVNAEEEAAALLNVCNNC